MYMYIYMYICIYICIYKSTHMHLFIYFFKLLKDKYLGNNYNTYLATVLQLHFFNLNQNKRE